MPKTIKPVWGTSDGAEWPSEKEAQRHQAVIEAAQALDDARREFLKATIKTYKTADGVPFDFRGRDYQRLVKWTPMPRLHRVAFYGGHFQEFQVDTRGRLLLLERDEKGNSTTYDIAELYANEREAKKALLAAMEEKLAEYAEQMEELKLQITPA